MNDSHDDRAVPPKEKGLRHLLHSTRYTLAGLGRLWQEPAFRQEALAFAAVAIWHLGFASPLWLILLQGVAALALFAVEALNTAIEELLDHISPGFSRTAKHGKDLGSFAVACLLLANGLIALAAPFI
ncbi:diacylglycerol kinase [Fulvimarina pelagi HTCC2506]|uniref:Diacylglycerol kinase n=1 Tax=Fulvimarina pelagi HTCC2506 TaxID=314231 RepID=Q0G2M2_9HYPH|nr:diacylglycerol kinase [Fulvimarina pelagi]EAU42159.1 diacylglycerol kinase [Fulvimarina pelagi HTCC2506]